MALMVLRLLTWAMLRQSWEAELGGVGLREALMQQPPICSHGYMAGGYDWRNNSITTNSQWYFATPKAIIWERADPDRFDLETYRDAPLRWQLGRSLRGWAFPDVN